MRNKAKPFFLATLPAVPYLVGVGLQVSGVTNIPLSVAIFETAALLAAAVAWALWSDWRATAFASPTGTVLAPIRRWGGLKIPKIGTIRTEILVAVLVLVLSNAAIIGFVSLAENRMSAAVTIKTGARLFAKVGPFTKVNKIAEVSIINSGDVIARMGAKVGSAQLLMDHILNEDDEDTLYKRALEKVPPIGRGGLEIPFNPINNGRTFNVDTNLTDADIDSILNGSKFFYVVAVIRFTDETTPKGQTNLASVCNYFTKRTDLGLVCSTHNESRVPE